MKFVGVLLVSIVGYSTSNGSRSNYIEGNRRRQDDENGYFRNRRQTRSGARHWASLIPPSRLVELTLDDSHLHPPPSSSINNKKLNTRNRDSGDAKAANMYVPNPASPQSVSATLEAAHDDAVSAAIAAGATIAEIESLVYGGGGSVTQEILNRTPSSSKPSRESSPYIFTMAPSDTQPWLTDQQLGMFVGGFDKLRPDIEEWVHIVIPSAPADNSNNPEKKITLAEILGDKGTVIREPDTSSSHGSQGNPRPAFQGPQYGGNPGPASLYDESSSHTHVTPSTASDPTTSNTAIAGATVATAEETSSSGYYIDPVTGVYIDKRTGQIITNPSGASTDIGASISSSIAGGGGLTTVGPISTVSSPSNVASTQTAEPTSYHDPTIQGGVQLQNPEVLPYPLSLPWYPRDGKPWVDPADLPSFFNPVVDAANAAAAAASTSTDPSFLRKFIENKYWDDGFWTIDGYYSYGPPCSVEEVVSYNQRLVALGEIDMNSLSGVEITGTVDVENGKINRGRSIPDLNYRGNEKWDGNESLNRCEGDCDDDSDCGAGLVCHQRQEREVVPGCAKWGKEEERKIGSEEGTDYCVREIDESAFSSGFYDKYSDPGLKMTVVDQEGGLLLPPQCTGPQGWADVVAMETPEAEYWKQFSKWIGPSLRKNQCGVSVAYNHNPTSNDFAGIFGAVAGVVGREIDDEDDVTDEETLDATFDSRIVEHQQSPIDVRRSMARAACFEYHQIRHKKGDFDIRDAKVLKQILPNKLRLVYPQEYNEKIWSDGVGGPSADMPKGWGHQLPTTHVDIKIPSEHWFEGKQYAAEYQIFLIQDRDSQRGAPAISVLIDLHPNDLPNIHLQKLLDQFQIIWDADMADCEGLVRRRSRLLTSLAGSNYKELIDDEFSDSTHESRWSEVLSEDDAEFEDYRANLRRNAQSLGDVWDIWHEDIITSNYFIGYEGSLTEPPCTEFISWRVMDRPALMSKRQLAQMKKLLFSHVDSKCRPTSNHYRGSVARPLQPFNDREMWQCTCRDYIGDEERKWYGRNRCWAGDEEVFHERTEDGLYWASKPPQPERKGVFDCGGKEDLVPPCCGKSYDPFHACCARGTC